MYKKIIFSLLCTTVFSTAAMAGLDEGIKAFSQQKYQQAFEEFSYLAEEGNNIAAYHLGLMYEQGLGVPASAQTAAQNYLKAYNAGNTTAASKLGQILIKGEGVEKNVDDGLNLLKTAGRAGDSDAQYQLGYLYEQGEDVDKNFVYAGGFYKMAALQGNKEAQHRLALLYLFGRGVPQDYPMTLKWLSRAANQGYIPAQKDLAELLSSNPRLMNIVEAYAWFSIMAAYNTDDVGTWAAKRRDEVAAKIQDAKNLSIAQQIARRWQPKAPSETVPEAELSEPALIIPGFNDENTLRELKEQNVTVISDGTEYGIRTEELEEAIVKKDTVALEAKINEWGRNGKPDAYTFWGKIVENRLQDAKGAFDWYLKGAQYGDPEGAFLTGKAYCEGKVVETNPVDCYMWLEVAAQKSVEPLQTLAKQTLAAVEPQLKPEEVTQAKQKAEGWKPVEETEKKSNFKLF